MKVIQDLQGNRPNIVHIFDQLVRTLPDGVYYTSVERKGKEFTINGVAENNNEISNLMRNLGDSPWFGTPELKTVTAKGDKAQVFTLTVVQSEPSTDSDTSGGQK
jgi:type IV pilus assembly protein PilN